LILSDFEQVIGITFNDPSLLQRALTHSSYVNENPGLSPVSNERLEFLGDAVLGLIIAGKIYRDCPQYDEGMMTQVRAILVRQETLARIAKTIKVDDFLCFGRGEGTSGGREKPANLAAALEAVIAAVYLDRGMPAAEGLVQRLFAHEIEKAIGRTNVTDYKSGLQEFIQSKYQLIPTYSLIKTEGPEHERTFTVEVRMGDVVLGQGTGHSKKSAEADAARSALGKLVKNFTRE
jgi:ribonuclease-3